jgi:hypothetical protein
VNLRKVHGRKYLKIVKKESDIRPTVDSIEHYHEGFHRILRQIYIVCSILYALFISQQH